MGPRHAEDTVADVEIAFSRWNALDDTREVYPHNKRIWRGGGQLFDNLEVDRIDPRIPHADEECAVRGGDGQLVDRRSFVELLYCECAHVSLLTPTLPEPFVP